MRKLPGVLCLVVGFTFCLSDPPVASSKEKDRSSIRCSLVPTAGKKYHHGTSDCTAEATIRVDSNAIHVNVTVTDDDLEFSSDPIHSDHVEVWVAIPEAEGQDIAYVMAADSSLWLVQSSADVELFKTEVQNPLLSRIFIGDSIRYRALKSGGDDDGMAQEIDYQLGRLRTNIERSRKSYVLYGQTHLGFLPQSSTPYLYDREFLSPLQRGLKCTLPDAGKECHCSVSITPHGYTLAATIPASALLFFSERATEHVKVLVDVIDVDMQKSEETVLSSSKSRRWGDPTTYMPLVPHGAFGDPRVTEQFPPKNIGNIVRPVFFRASSGWMAVGRREENYIYKHRLFPFELPNLASVEFTRQGSGCRLDSLAGKPVRIYTVPDPGSTLGQLDIVVFNDGSSVAVAQCVDVFALPSGKPGLLVASYEYTMGGCFESGMCGCSLEGELVLLTDIMSSRSLDYGDRPDPKHQLQIVHWSGCDNEVFFSDSVRFSEVDLDVSFEDTETPESGGESNPFDWRSIISVVPREHRLTMVLGNGVMVGADWDETAGTVSYKLLGGPIEKRSSEE